MGLPFSLPPKIYGLKHDPNPTRLDIPSLWLADETKFRNVPVNPRLFVACYFCASIYLFLSMKLTGAPLLALKFFRGGPHASKFELTRATPAFLFLLIKALAEDSFFDRA